MVLGNLEVQDWGTVNEDHALEILHEFEECGGNFIETADVYGMVLENHL
ncbi:hypothetical protein ADIARSV_3484 [Arcticibacter svalbardensis MN12-7]|uniref:NADP-dependent oxidoreductase domain-containing protein n=1 Tax=Arcticibacter svalbardensis MN12-7 TaxID=1150600 RepID=R9GPD1_9SPHI|nr:aldo/keto reductase [Arcticibacter svalbardensis]EOR93405.1 hypothetical protein ADIARSV_3484 [Arcticibacter svalbardensis MN12-7]